LYVLARAGRPDVGAMDYVREHEARNLRTESRALLAAAYASVGNTGALEAMLRDLDDAEQIQRQTGGNLGSTIRNRALLLLGFLDAAPEDPRVPVLVDRLARDLRVDPCWTTQDSAFTLVALGQLVHRQAAKGAYSGAVWVGDTKVGSFGGSVVTFPGLSGDAPIRVEMDPGYASGAAFFSAVVRGIPTDARFAPASAGLEVERAFLGRDGTPLDLAAVRQGDLVVMRTRLRSTSGALDNVVLEGLLPAGLEVENPRLATTEK